MRPTKRVMIALAGGALLAFALALAGCGALVTSAPPINATGSTAITRSFATPVAGPALYQTPLTSYATGWSTAPVCHFGPNGLEVRPSGGQGYICLAPLPATADVAVSVTVQQLTGSPSHAFGIVVRHAAAHSYYFYGIDGKGRFTLAVVVNDVSHTVIPFTVNSAIHAGPLATNLLQVIAHGATLTLLANGTPVGQATVTTFASGTVGLRGISDGNVLFQNLVIAKAP